MNVDKLLLLFSCLYPLQVQARYVGYTSQQLGLCVQDSELGFVSVLAVNEREEAVLLILPLETMWS